MIVSRRAPVRPRVLSSVTGESLLLEENVQALVEDGKPGVIRITGPAGSGKTTALEHLAYLFAEANIEFLDCPASDPLPALVTDRLVVYTPAEPKVSAPTTETYCLAPWREDEWIEYLLNVHKERCTGVMLRLRKDSGRDLLGGSPDLWRIALDQMADDESISCVWDALLNFINERFPSPELRSLVHKMALDSLLRTGSGAVERIKNDLEELNRLAGGETDDSLNKQGAKALLTGLLRHISVRMILAVPQILGDIQAQADCDYFGRRFPRALVQLAAEQASRHPSVLDELRGWFSSRPERHAMAASILHAGTTGWRPAPGCIPKLSGAYLDHVIWPGIALPGVDLCDADLSHADLEQANLNGARAVKADFSHACLRGASLQKLVATEAILAHADLSESSASAGFFDSANLERANLQGGDFREASFAGARLVGANFTGAGLRHASFASADLEDATFAGADLEGAILSGVKLHDADFTAARFRGARMIECDLEGMDLPAADFRDANLTGALLTGSSMPDALFERACLSGAGLADIDWERASLREANLRGVSFHLGSSRSGLVGSPIACEGSRTGFYTDDFTEQEFKAPEEIRKANLCHADLRGARIDGVDFYLVDLRNALFDPEQEVHFRRCGAILEGRAERRK